MKILALEHETPGLTSADFAQYLKDEARCVYTLHQQGLIRELYFRTDEHSAVLVLECSSVDEAREVLARLPLVKAGLIRFEIIPLQAYPGFSRLFDNEDSA